MGLFRPYERGESAKGATSRTLISKPDKASQIESDKAEPSPVSKSRTVGGKKQGPTPTRKAAEAARMERLHPKLDKRTARKKARMQSRIAQDERWRKLEELPERVFLRDFVDARWTLLEFTLPGMLIFLAAMMATSYPALIYFAPYVSMALMVFFFCCIVNSFLLWRRFKLELASRLPNATYRGLLMYLLNRSMMIRRFRQPSPRISRGDSY